MSTSRSLSKVQHAIDANVFLPVSSEDAAENVEYATALAAFVKARKTAASVVEFRGVESADHSSAFPAAAVQGMYWLTEVEAQPE